MGELNKDPKPCRCCGKVPKLKRWYRDGSMWRITCDNKRCAAVDTVFATDRNKAIENWNKMEET